VDPAYLERVLDAEMLPPTRVILPRSKRRVDIVTLLRSEVRAGVTAAKCDDCFAPNKPVLKFGRRRTWAEFVVLGLLERDGWSGRWIKNWSGPRRPRIQFCSAIGQESLITDPAAAAMFAALDEEAGHPQGGIWDIFAWRGDEYLVIESKQYRRSDNLHDDQSQLAWLEACVRVGLPLDSFALVRYDAGPALKDPPVVDLRGRVADAEASGPHRDQGLGRAGLVPDRRRGGGGAQESVRVPRQGSEDRPGRSDNITATSAGKAEPQDGEEASRVWPTQAQIDDARSQVARRGWQTSGAAHHASCPKAIREDDGRFRPCEHCHAERNPARWPLFFRDGSYAGQLLWTCSTCKLSQADERSSATLLVEPPQL